jgi:hypothetical protein
LDRAGFAAIDQWTAESFALTLAPPDGPHDAGRAVRRRRVPPARRTSTRSIRAMSRPRFWPRFR